MHQVAPEAQEDRKQWECDCGFVIRVGANAETQSFKPSQETNLTA
jgi:hypothetical protein